MDESIQLKDVVVTAQALKNTENAVQTIQRKSLSTIDGISNQVFSPQAIVMLLRQLKESPEFQFRKANMYLSEDWEEDIV